MPFYHNPSSPSKHELKRNIVQATKDDNNWAFVCHMRYLFKYHIAEGDVYTYEFSTELLKNICLHRAVKCATCLLEGDSRLTVDDLNVVVEEGLTPLHLAARNLSYDLTKLFLQYGANPNLSCDCDSQLLPLGFALEALSNHQLVTNNWSLDKLPHTLLYLFFLKEMVEPFDTIGLLASRTTKEHLEKISLGYAEEGEVVKLTALLIVAWDKLVTPYDKHGVEWCPIGRCVLKAIQSLSDDQETSGSNLEMLHDRKTKLEAVWKMLEVLWVSYDRLNAYRYGLTGQCFKKHHKETIFNHQVPWIVSREMISVKGMLQDVFADLECFKPGLSPKDKGLLDEALQNQKRSGSAILHVPTWRSNWQKGIVASFCGARKFHTSSNVNLRKELKGQLPAAKVAKPTFQQLPTYRMCTLLGSIAKRGFK